MNTKVLFIGVLLFVGLHKVNAQVKATDSGGDVQKVQPKIMVIPYVKEGEDLRTILEADVNKRICITKIKESFDNRGFTTVDFVAKLKAAKDNNVFTSNNQTDIKSQIIQMSGADVYVQAEVNVDKGQNGTEVRLILTAYESSTGNSLSNKVGNSGRWFSDDIAKMATKAVDQISEDFLNVMQTKFTDIVNNGKSIIIDVSIDPSSSYNLSSEMGPDGLPLSDLLEIWMEESSYKNNYHIQGTTDLKMIFDDVKIPLIDQSTGKNYQPNRFALEIWKFLKSPKVGLTNVGKEIKGNTVYITIK
jgi:hypothetical protein